MPTHESLRGSTKFWMSFLLSHIPDSTKRLRSSSRSRLLSSCSSKSSKIPTAPITDKPNVLALLRATMSSKTTGQPRSSAKANGGCFARIYVQSFCQCKRIPARRTFPQTGTFTKLPPCFFGIFGKFLDDHRWRKDDKKLLYRVNVLEPVEKDERAGIENRFAFVYGAAVLAFCFSTAASSRFHSSSSQLGKG